VRQASIDDATDFGERECREKRDFLSNKNSRGEFADFHATRHTFITNLARAGVSPKEAHSLARHSDIRLTMEVHTHTDLAEKAAAVGRLPGPCLQYGSTNGSEIGNFGHSTTRQSTGSIP
jgi:hypothetical protein